MKRSWSWLVFAALALFVSGLLFADEKPSPEKVTAEQINKLLDLSDKGRVTKAELEEFLKKHRDSQDSTAPHLTPLKSGVAITATSKYAVSGCFVVQEFAYRDPHFDKWLPKEMPAVTAGNACSYSIANGTTFAEIVAEHLKMVGSSIEVLKKELVKREMTFSLKQIEQIFVNCSNFYNPFYLSTDGWANIFFVVVGDRCFVVGAYRGSDG